MANGCPSIILAKLCLIKFPLPPDFVPDISFSDNLLGQIQRKLLGTKDYHPNLTCKGIDLSENTN